MMMSLLERLNHAFSGGIMFVQPSTETQQMILVIYIRCGLNNYHVIQFTQNSLEHEVEKGILFYTRIEQIHFLI